MFTSFYRPLPRKPDHCFPTQIVKPCNTTEHQITNQTMENNKEDILDVDPNSDVEEMPEDDKALDSSQDLYSQQEESQDETLTEDNPDMEDPFQHPSDTSLMDAESTPQHQPNEPDNNQTSGPHKGGTPKTPQNEPTLNLKSSGTQDDNKSTNHENNEHRRKTRQHNRGENFYKEMLTGKRDQLKPKTKRSESSPAARTSEGNRPNKTTRNNELETLKQKNLEADGAANRLTLEISDYKKNLAEEEKKNTKLEQKITKLKADIQNEKEKNLRLTTKKTNAETEQNRIKNLNRDKAQEIEQLKEECETSGQIY